MVKHSLKRLALFVLLSSSILSSKIAQSGAEGVRKDQESLAQTQNWIPLSIEGAKASGATKTLKINSINSEAGFALFDEGSNTCYLHASVNQSLVGLNSVEISQTDCLRSTVTKIDKAGHVLFLFGDGTYAYTTKQGQGGISSKLKIQGDLIKATVKGIQYGLTKSTEFYNSTSNDYFRIFSKASDPNGYYPSNFYILVSNSTGNTFTDSPYNTLTVQRTPWTFKNTPNKFTFTKINQVNFVSDHEEKYVLEAQWITGMSHDSQSSVSSDFNNCQYGAVNTIYFAKEPSLTNPTMYGSGIHFPCNMKANTTTYQGIISYTSTVNYFYALDPAQGTITLCPPPGNGDLNEYTSFDWYTQGNYQCFNNFSGPDKVNITSNEYFTGVSSLGSYRVIVFVNIRDRTDTMALRQAEIILDSQNNLPTIDKDTYYYTASSDKLWRIKKVFQAGEKLQIEYYQYSQNNLDRAAKIENKLDDEGEAIDPVLF